MIVVRWSGGRTGRAEMGCVGQRGARCTRQSSPAPMPTRIRIGQPRADAAAIVDGAGDSNGGGYDQMGRPGVGRPSGCPGGRCLLLLLSGRRRRLNSTSSTTNDGRGSDRRPVPADLDRPIRELSGERRQVKPRRRRNHLFRTRDRHHLSRRRGHARPNPSCTTCWRQPA